MKAWLDRLRSLPLLRVLAIGAVVLLFLALAGVGGWAWYNSQESRARAALAEALELEAAAQATDAAPGARDTAIKALEGVLAAHGGSGAAPEAAYRLGNLQYAAGRWGPARGAYEVAIAKGARGAVRTMSEIGIGYCWEAEKDYARARSAFEAVAQRLGPQDALWEEAWIAVARVQETAGDPEAAARTYERLLKEGAGSRVAEEIRSRLARLQARGGS